MLWPKQEAKEWRKENPEQSLLSNAKQRATSKGLEFDITVSDIVIPEICPYLKRPFVRGTMYAPSLDRINPKRGYVKGNIEVISRKANVMKNNASIEELLEFAYTILERN